MAVTVHWYPNGLLTAVKGEWDWVNDDIRLALLDNTYTYSDAHDYFADVVGDEESDASYTAGGNAIGTTTATYTEDQNATSWAASTAYNVGDVVRKTTADGHVYRCIAVTGNQQSGASEPTWDTTPGQDTTDNNVTWTEAGRGYVTLDGDNVQWTNSTITCRYGVIYNRTPATDADRPLIGFIDFGQDESTTNDTFQVTFHTDGILRLFPGYGGT